MTVFGSKYLFWAVVIIAIVLLFIFLINLQNKLKRQKVVNLAMREYKLWQNGQTKETNAAMRDDLTKYWLSAGKTDYGYGAAWSAAFISYLFKNAGAGSRFPYAVSHSTYIRQAVKNRQAGVTSNAIIAYQPNEYKVKPGDLICYPRQSGVDYFTNNPYDSHCDLVVDVVNNQAITIGGNVSNSVSKTIYPLKNGYVNSSKVHAVIKNAL